MLLATKLDTIQEDQLQALVSNAVAEGKTIEYKRLLPGNTDGDKKEFLADVSSFANTVGGHILYGIDEKDSLPSSLDGVTLSNANGEILRLEEIIRTGIEPRIQGVAIAAITLANKKTAVVIYIPRSWQSPHRISFKNDGKFYARNSKGKYQLDIAEIRSAFVLSDTAAERIKNFRAERLSKILADDLPRKLSSEKRVVLHLLPLYFGEPLPNFNIPFLIEQAHNQDIMQPFTSWGWDHRPNLDGILTFDGGREDTSVNYLQLFRTGAIESVSSHITIEREEGGSYIPSIGYEKELIEVTAKYLKLHQLLEIEPPIFAMISFLNVKGARLGVDEFRIHQPDHPFIDRDHLILPEVRIDDYGADIAQVLRPVFDAVWNAAGWQRSWNYNEQGEWKPRQ
jgi:hypothetical protein